MRRVTSQVAATLTSAGLLVVSGCSLVLDFSADPDAAVVDANPTCLAFEPNDTRPTAVPLDDPGPTVAAICGPADVDYYRFDVMTNQDALIELSFSNGAGTGDLELRLFAVGQVTAIAVENGTSDQEVISRTAANATQLAAGAYEIGVAPTNTGNESEYSLSVTLTPGP